MPSAKRRPRLAVKPEPSARIRRRERRRDRSREEILEAARRVLVRNGVAATTLDAGCQGGRRVEDGALLLLSLEGRVIFRTGPRSARVTGESGPRRGRQGKRRRQLRFRSIIRESVNAFAPRLDDFRLAFLHGQVADKGAVSFQSAAVRGASVRSTTCCMGMQRGKLEEERKRRRAAPRSSPASWHSGLPRRDRPADTKGNGGKFGRPAVVFG